MDFNFTTKEEKFKQEVVDFFMEEKALADKAKKEWNSGQGFGPNIWKILKKIGAKGWLCPTWPKKYGGLDLPYMNRYIIQEQMHRFTAIYATVGAGMAGPVVLKQGTEQQKDQFLLPIARGEIEFVLGYSEPESGSDLASLTISAEDKGDHFIINGQKMFNTRAHFAQYHWLGVRTKVTTPKHKGISLFIVDLKTPGITITPYYTLGNMRTNGVFYDNVKVPHTALVGEKNKGFYYILEALAYERISTVAGLENDFKEIVAFVKMSGKGKDPLVRQKIADTAIDLETVRLIALKVAWMLNIGKIPSHEAAMLKIMVSEMEQEMLNAAMQIMGPYGQIQTGSKWSQIDGQIEWRYRDSLEALVTRGTSEILRTVVAERGLKLPRG